MLLLLFLLVGCDSNSSWDARTAQIDSRFLEPPPRPPEWPVGWKPTTTRSEPMPVVQLNGPGDVAHTVVEATIIDTREFPVQRQSNDPWSGPTARPGTLLPSHSRDKNLPPGRRVDVPLGRLIEVDRVKVAPRFTAMSQTAWTPPDPTLAVGPTHIISTVNMAVAFYDREGNEEFFANLDSTGSPGFFEELGAGDFTFDPKCFYDHGAERFVILALEYYSGNDESWITIAVSDDNDPHGVWYKYRTPSVVSIDNTDYWVDYPGFGFDNDVYTVTGNLFWLDGSGPGFGGVLYRIFRKWPMLTGDPVVFSDLVDENIASVQCAQHHGNNVAPFFVSLESESSMRVQAIRSPTTTPQLFTASVDVPSFDSNPPGGSNPGGSIDTLDGRIMNAHWRDGNLVFAHAIGDGNKCQVRWYNVDTGDWPGIFGNQTAPPVLVQSGAIDLPSGEHGFFPAVASNAFGDIGLVFGHCRSDVFPNVQVTGRFASDPPGSMGTPEIVVESPSGASGRWGDYFDLTVDPLDDTTFWYIGEWSINGNWQTWIGSFEISPPGCPGDTDGNGLVNVLDILAVISLWNADCTMLPSGCMEDVNNDGMVDVADLLMVIANWNCSF